MERETTQRLEGPPFLLLALVLISVVATESAAGGKAHSPVSSDWWHEERCQDVGFWLERDDLSVSVDFCERRGPQRGRGTEFQTLLEVGNQINGVLAEGSEATADPVTPETLSGPSRRALDPPRACPR